MTNLQKKNVFAITEFRRSEQELKARKNNTKTVKRV